MVTHKQNLCSAFNPSKVHTHSSGQPFSSWGFGALLKGTSVVVLKVESVLYIHSPHLQSLPARDSNSQPFNYESDSLTIRPRLPWSPYIPLNIYSLLWEFLSLIVIQTIRICLWTMWDLAVKKVENYCCKKRFLNVCVRGGVNIKSCYSFLKTFWSMTYWPL